MSDFSLNNAPTVDSSPEARAALDAALASFSSQPTVQGTVSGSVNSTPTAEIIDSEEISPALEQPKSQEETETEEVDDTEEEEVDLTEFDKEFSKRFGTTPEEAVETINSLLAFRDEMTLMRTWGVTAGEYDSRMTQVKDFYKTLPEDKQPEFNSLEGAKAIWEHLEKTSSSLRKKNSTVSKVGGSKKTTPAHKPTFIKKSEILKMDKATYESRLPEITKAFREGRVLEND